MAVPKMNQICDLCGSENWSLSNIKKDGTMKHVCTPCRRTHDATVTIGVTYCAFSQSEHVAEIVASGRDPYAMVIFEYVQPFGKTFTDHDILNALFEQTNFYKGDLWDKMQPLPENRTHTSTSVGDRISILRNSDGVLRIYRCASAGWDLLDEIASTVHV